MMDDRPDPDALLALAKAEEERARRGKLKVFFGATAGVGKTYAMLEAARELQRRGVDVVVGWVETHGRKETEALLEGLEILPPREVEHRGITLRGIRPRRRPGPPAGGGPGRRAGPHQRARARATPSAGRTSRSCSPPASTSTPRSTSSTWRA